MTDKHQLFEEFVQECSKNNFYIGQGNPDSEILFIGCEPSVEQKKNNDEHTFECLNELRALRTFGISVRKRERVVHGASIKR